MRVPERIGYRIIIHAVFRIIQIAVDSSAGVVLAIVRIGVSIFGERNGRIGRFKPIERKFVAELELSGTVDKIDITFEGLPVRSLHHTVHVTIAQADSVADLIFTTFGIEIMLMSESRTDRLVEPIGIDSPFDFLQSFITEIVQSDLYKRIVCIVLIYAGECLELKFLTSIHKVVVAQICQ